MLRFTLRQLEYLVAAADRGSVAAAAGELNVSQPSVSAALAKLEQQLGAQLLIRHHAQGVTLTPTGRRLMAEARNLLNHARELQRHAETAGTGLSGELHVAAFVTLAAAFMPALIESFTAAHPQLRINLSEGTQNDLVAGLRQGRFELALLYDVNVPADLRLQPLAAFDPYVLLPAGHSLARLKKISLRLLGDEPLILLDVPPSRDYFIGLLTAAGIEPRIAFSSPSLELVRGLVGRGLGYSLLVTRPHGDRTYDGRPLAVRPIAEKGTRGEIAIAALASLRPTRASTAFTEHCRNWFAGWGR